MDGSSIFLLWVPDPLFVIVIWTIDLPILPNILHSQVCHNNHLRGFFLIFMARSYRCFTSCWKEGWAFMECTIALRFLRSVSFRSNVIPFSQRNGSYVIAIPINNLPSMWVTEVTKVSVFEIPLARARVGELNEFYRTDDTPPSRPRARGGAMGILPLSVTSVTFFINKSQFSLTCVLDCVTFLVSTASLIRCCRRKFQPKIQFVG